MQREVLDVDIHSGEGPFDVLTRRIQLKVMNSNLRMRGLMAQAQEKVVKGGPDDQWIYDEVVPRSHLIGLGVYHVMEAVRQWRKQHPKRKTVPWSEVEKWIEGMELTIPIELDRVISE